MISLNLLPDVKKQFLKAERTRNMIFTFSIIGSAVAVGLVVVGFIAVGGMRFQINRNVGTIEALETEYAEIDNLSQILTVRNQASALPGLHDEKPVASRLFKLLSLTTPQNVELNEVMVDFTENTMEVTAATRSFKDVNVYIDTLKNTYFNAGDDSQKQFAFSEIVSEQLIDDDQVIVVITMEFQPGIFNSASKVKFSVPDIETTQSERQKPLFNEPVNQEGDQDG